MVLLAAKLNIDPAEFRRRNLIRPAEMPWHVGTVGGGHPTRTDSGDFPAIFERALTEFGWNQQPGRLQDGRAIGRGISVSVEPSALGVFESARVEVDLGGNVRVITGCTSQGQGQETSLGAGGGGSSGCANQPDHGRSRRHRPNPIWRRHECESHGCDGRQCCLRRCE